MRQAISDLVEMGQFPHELDTSEEDLARREALVLKLEPPATEEEARALLVLLGEDSLFGLAWSLVSMIESAPGWPYWDELANTSEPWRSTLRQAAINAGHSPPD